MSGSVTWTTTIGETNPVTQFTTVQPVGFTPFEPNHLNASFSVNDGAHAVMPVTIEGVLEQ